MYYRYIITILRTASRAHESSPDNYFFFDFFALQ
jgi:hypothetical protein